METINQTNNTTTQLTFCWSPNTISLLSNHRFMITRQILRLVIYYLMPFVFISIFYSIIAKTLFRTKDVIYSKVSSSCSFKNDSRNEENCSTNIRHSRESKLMRDAKARKQLRARHKVAKTVLSLCLVFFICWLPKQLHDLYWYINLKNKTFLFPNFILGLLVYLSIHQNGIIFGK